MNNILLEEWMHTGERESFSMIVPDGCRDIILIQDIEGSSSCFISSLASSTYDVKITAGVQFHGFRLTPGTTINEASFRAFIENNPSLDKIDKTWLEHFCSMKSSVHEALEGVRSDLDSIGIISRNLGVSVRTLQRHIKSETGMSPQFWRSLVRARRCARTLEEQPSLAEAALRSGYSDQSHMTRELQRWFNCTPSALKSGCLQTEINFSGYD
ncbi:helix-turn-helix domain-containing protein [Agaribacter marinus]|nr:helix-turn-helix domain-containing protein [Agaribacter marinus]